MKFLISFAFDKLNEFVRSEPKLNVVENSKNVKREKIEKEKKLQNEEEQKFAIEEEAKVTTLDVDDFPDLTKNDCNKN